MPSQRPHEPTGLEDGLNTTKVTSMFIPAPSSIHRPARGEAKARRQYARDGPTPTFVPGIRHGATGRASGCLPWLPPHHRICRRERRERSIAGTFHAKREGGWRTAEVA